MGTSWEGLVFDVFAPPNKPASSARPSSPSVEGTKRRRSIARISLSCRRDLAQIKGRETLERWAEGSVHPRRPELIPDSLKSGQPCSALPSAPAPFGSCGLL